jgi:hypothetical protein
MNITEIKLPPKTHATILTGRDIVTGGDLAYAIVWADRPYDTCPLCHQPVEREITDPPVLLNTGAGVGGAIQEWSKQHGCGFWLSVNWTEVTPSDNPDGESNDCSHDQARDDDVECPSCGAELLADDEAPNIGQLVPGLTELDILHAAEKLAVQLNYEIGDQRQRIEKDLQKDLQHALARLAEPLADDETLDDRADEVTNGNETEPGVYRDGDQWLAWTYDPAGSGDCITVYAQDLTLGPVGATEAGA